MAENYGFFNAVETAGTYDRVYDASSFAKVFSLFMTNGVFAKEKTSELQVKAKSGLTVTVKAGRAFIDGYWYELTEDADIIMASNTSAYAVRSVVTCKLDRSARKITINKRDAVTSVLPVNDGTVHELVLAIISLGVGVSTISQSMITDTRGDNSYCGFVTGLVDSINTTDLFAQFQTSFNEWFERMKNQLTTDAAGNLQTQITALNGGSTSLMLDYDYGKSRWGASQSHKIAGNNKMSFVINKKDFGFNENFTDGLYQITLNVSISLLGFNREEMYTGNCGLNVTTDRNLIRQQGAFCESFNKENVKDVYSISVIVKLKKDDDFGLEIRPQLFDYEGEANVNCNVEIDKLGGYVDER